MSDGKRIVAYVPDLMDRSRFSALDGPVDFVKSPQELVEKAADADLLVVDLGRPGVIDVIGQLGPQVRTVGFASHVDREGIEAARAAGVGEVLPRSKFFSQIRAICG